MYVFDIGGTERVVSLDLSLLVEVCICKRSFTSHRTALIVLTEMHFESVN